MKQLGMFFIHYCRQSPATAKGWTLTNCEDWSKKRATCSPTTETPVARYVSFSRSPSGPPGARLAIIINIPICLCVDQAEFVVFMALRANLVEQDDVDDCLEAFRKLDKNKSGTLTLEDCVFLPDRILQQGREQVEKELRKIEV